MILTFEDIKSSHALPIPLSHQALGEHWWYPGFGRAHPRRAGMWRVNSWFLKQKMPYGMQKLRPSCNWKIHQHTNHDHIDCDMASDAWKDPKGIFDILFACILPGGLGTTLDNGCQTASGPPPVRGGLCTIKTTVAGAVSGPPWQHVHRSRSLCHNHAKQWKLDKNVYASMCDSADYRSRNWIAAQKVKHFCMLEQQKIQLICKRVFEMTENSSPESRKS